MTDYKKEIDGNELFKRIAGHSYYKGDDILTRISLMQEGKLLKEKDIKPVDARPVVKARWEDETGYIFSEPAQRVYCPVCKSYAYFTPMTVKNFCPSCGADMRPEKRANNE